MATNWFNNDGLLVKFGTNEATPGVAGEYGTLKSGNVHVLECRLTLLNLVDAASALAIVDENAWLPKNARIEEVEVLNTEAAATGVTLDLGLIRFDRTTELDYDGLLAAAPIADWNALGEKKLYTVGVTGAGALMGTVLANPGYIVATYNTAFTAGKLNVRIGYSFP